MAQPCIQGERIAKIETKNDAIMQRLESIEDKIDKMASMMADFKLAAEKEFAKKSEVDSICKKQTGLENEITGGKSFLRGVGVAIGILGTAVVSLIVYVAKITLKLP